MKPARLPVPQRESEHADETRQRVGQAPLDDGRQHDLGVGTAAEAMALGLELGSQVGEVVDLAVVGDGRNRPSAECMGWAPSSERSMMARRRCPSATPASASTQTPAESGAAVDQRVGHPPRGLGKRRRARPRARFYESGKPTHRAMIPARAIVWSEIAPRRARHDFPLLKPHPGQ